MRIKMNKLKHFLPSCFTQRTKSSKGPWVVSAIRLRLHKFFVLLCSNEWQSLCLLHLMAHSCLESLILPPKSLPHPGTSPLTNTYPSGHDSTVKIEKFHICQTSNSILVFMIDLIDYCYFQFT